MSTDCRKVVVTIEIPDGKCCASTGPGDGAGTGGEPQPVPTPFLVIPSAPGDAGTRPLSAAQALYSQAIGWTIANPAAPGGWNDFQVALSCAVANLGAVASPAALIEFYTGAAIGIWQPGHATLTPGEVKAGVRLVGRASFTAPPGTVSTVRCPKYWVPGSEDAAKQGILVQVRDLFTDRWTAPFDAVNDRHVGRNDRAMLKVWNTGVDGNGAKLAPGTLDPHWRLVAGPGVANSRAPFVLADQHPYGQYFETVDSMWIWQDAAAPGEVGLAYTFRLPLDLTGFDPTTVTISGAWGVDNDGAVLLNGQAPTGTGTFSLTNASPDNYNVEHAFAITGGFVAGLNALEFQATNADGPAGVNVTRLTISGTPA